MYELYGDVNPLTYGGMFIKADQDYFDVIKIDPVEEDEGYVRAYTGSVYYDDIREYMEKRDSEEGEPDKTSLKEALIDMIDEEGLEGISLCYPVVDVVREYSIGEMIATKQSVAKALMKMSGPEKDDINSNTEIELFAKKPDITLDKFEYDSKKAVTADISPDLVKKGSEIASLTYSLYEGGYGVSLEERSRGTKSCRAVLEIDNESGEDCKVFYKDKTYIGAENFPSDLTELIRKDGYSYGNDKTEAISMKPNSYSIRIYEEGKEKETEDYLFIKNVKAGTEKEAFDELTECLMDVYGVRGIERLSVCRYELEQKTERDK